jgi:myo-inositol catabolism protein IolC
MSLGYDRKLFVLAFDHRGSFKKKMFGISGREPNEEEYAALRDAKRLIWEGVRKALEEGAPADRVGVLVDEEMGADVAREAKASGVRLAMPVEASGQPVFDFEYGESFGEHIESFDPDFAKVLVRWNPADTPEDKAAQGGRLRRLSEWLHARERKFLFELLVPATDEQLVLAGGDAAAYDAEIRPTLTLEAIAEIQAAGIQPDIWKIEGLERASQCELLAGLIRRDGRDGVMAVVLGRGADDAKVDHWLEQGAGVDGYDGFAIGRTIWWQGVEGYKDGTLDREAAAADIAGRYRHFIDLYERASG